MFNMQKPFDINCSVDFNEIEKGIDTDTNQACYVAHGTAHFYVEQEGEHVYTNGFSNPTAIIDTETNTIRIEALTSFWQDTADEEEIEFNDLLQTMVNNQADELCTKLASDKSVREQLSKLIITFNFEATH